MREEAVRTERRGSKWDGKKIMGRGEKGREAHRGREGKGKVMERRRWEGR